jgi:parvulin-like peptidyl-prolyl isomerase
LPKRFIPPSVAAFAGFAVMLAGCQNPGSESHVVAENTPVSPGKTAPPLLASASSPTTGPVSVATTQLSNGAAEVHTGEVVAELNTAPSQQKLQITRGQLDDLLYKTYGTQAVFDLVEFQLAKNTLAVLGKTLDPSDIDRERDIVFSNMFKEAQKSDYEGLFNQFLQKEKIKREVFELEAIQTSAALRKIVEPMVIGKFSDNEIRHGYEVLYGSKRQIEDITVANQVEAEKVKSRVKSEPFEKVAREMSIDKDTRDAGGLWEPFSAQATQVPKIILESAFTMDLGQVSDTLQDGTNCHIIKVVDVIDPKVVKYDDVKAAVRKQMEDLLIEKKMKFLRQQLQLQASQQIRFDEPVLKAQWDEVLARQQPKAADKNAVRSQLDHQTPAGK